MKHILITLCLTVGVSHAADIAPTRSVTYKSVSETELKIDVFEPAGFKATDRRPAIVFFFGGGWVGGSTSQFYQQAKVMTDQGMVAFSADYRVASRNKTTPVECVKDGKSAIRWVREHASELGIDPDRIVAAGGSSRPLVMTPCTWASMAMASPLDCRSFRPRTVMTPAAEHPTLIALTALSDWRTRPSSSSKHARPRQRQSPFTST